MTEVLSNSPNSLTRGKRRLTEFLGVDNAEHGMTCISALKRCNDSENLFPQMNTSYFKKARLWENQHTTKRCERETDERFSKLKEANENLVSQKDLLTKCLSEHIQREKELVEAFQAQAEENKLLKRAVAIQENRLRQTSEEKSKLLEILDRAGRRLNDLEESNRQLRYQLLYGNAPSPFTSFPDPPPDVF
jgi:hypothetical protein